MRKNDFSLHFTLKDQSFPAIRDEFYSWAKDHDFLISQENDPRLVLHHCFLPRAIIQLKKFSEDVVDFLDGITEDVVCWYGAAENLQDSRTLMLQNLKRVNGIAIFVGEIKEGVKEEYDLAVNLGVDILHIGGTLVPGKGIVLQENRS